MSANRRQMLEAAYVAAFTTARRRSVPTRPRMAVPTSLHERWRERPGRRARRLTPGCPDGVVHAIVRRAPCRCLCGQFVQENRAASVHSRAARSDGRSVAASLQGSVRAGTSFCGTADASSAARSSGTTIAPVMLAPCSASSMLSASLRPGRWPGLRALTTPARGTHWPLRDGGQLMTVYNDLDASITWAYGGLIASVPLGTPPVSPQRHPERAFRRQPRRHGLERIPHKIAACSRITDSR